MPTSIAHAVGGYAASEAASSQTHSGHSPWTLAFAAAVIANIPDLDFVPGLLVDNIPVFHRTMSHGIPAALLVATVGAVLGGRWWKGTWRTLWIFIFVTYTSHLVLDVFVPDPTGGDGIRMFWPITTTWVVYPLPFLEPLNGIRILDHGPTNSTFWGALFSGRAVSVFLIDGVIILPLVALGKGIGALMRRRKPSEIMTAAPQAR